MRNPHTSVKLIARLLFASLVASIVLLPLSLAAEAKPAPVPAQKPFPDFGFMLAPAQYSGPVFKLRQDYPTKAPKGLPEFFDKLPASFSPNFEDWRAYMLAIRSYCFVGNTAVDWRVEQNHVRRWFHIPWQHYGPSGREGFHGLTKEAPVQPGQLAAGQGIPAPNDNFQTYAVGFYNEQGGYAIGQVWKDHENPDLGAIAATGFPEGTVVSKLLFVDVPIEQVPFLVNPVQWQGFITGTFGTTDRTVRSLSLIQMDIAVKDHRAPSGWFFGTFQYNGALRHSDPWENLVPVGIMWGNDPSVTDSAYTNPNPVVTKINPSLKESAINANTRELPPSHLGWNGRLNGPVDNPQSSCISCHMTAEYPTLSPSSPLFLPKSQQPAVGSPGWMRWFQNEKCGAKFDAETQSADFSLQLAIGVANFHEWVEAQGGLDADAYSPAPAPASVQTRADAAAPKHKRKHYQIKRDVAPAETREP